MDVKPHIFRSDERLLRARRGNRHPASQNAELRPDVPAQIAFKPQLIAAALLDLPHHVTAKIVGVNQQYQRCHPCHNNDE